MSFFFFFELSKDQKHDQCIDPTNVLYVGLVSVYFSVQMLIKANKKHH